MSVKSDGEIFVKKGSRARLKTTPTIPKGTVALRENLLKSEILLEQQGTLLFTSDYVFPSVSAAPAAVPGASANGRISWRLPDGRTYAEWEEGQNASPIAIEDEDLTGGAI